MAETPLTAGFVLFVAFGVANLFWPSGAGVIWNRFAGCDPPLEPAIIRLLGTIFLTAAVVTWISSSN